MKRTITISACIKRTFSLGNYENIAPTYTASETLELGGDEEFTPEQYSSRLDELRAVCMGKLVEDYKAIKKQ